MEPTTIFFKGCGYALTWCKLCEKKINVVNWLKQAAEMNLIHLVNWMDGVNVMVKLQKDARWVGESCLDSLPCSPPLPGLLGQVSQAGDLDGQAEQRGG